MIGRVEPMPTLNGTVGLHPVRAWVAPSRGRGWAGDRGFPIGERFAVSRVVFAPVVLPWVCQWPVAVKCIQSLGTFQDPPQLQPIAANSRTVWSPGRTMPGRWLARSRYAEVSSGSTRLPLR